MAATLPEEVTERLAVHGRVRLSVGEETPAVAEVGIAPLHRQLFLLVPRGGGIERRLDETTRASFVAEDKGGEYVIRVTGRAVAGRSINAEPRRPELMHWLPEGTSPAGLVAVRFHPEDLEYIKGKGVARNRVAGPVPEGAVPPAITRWWTLATDGVIAWVFVLAVADWAGLLYLKDPNDQKMLLLLLMVLGGVALLTGVALVDQSARLARWRESFESEARASLMLAGWESPARVRVAGFGMMCAGGILASLLALGAGWRIGLWMVFTSGAPFLAAFYGARHALRRRDAEEERG